MNENKTHLKIITPNGLFFDGEVSLVTVKTQVGYIGLQHGKSPFVASLDIAELNILEDSNQPKKSAAVAGGLVYVTPSKIDIITDAIEYKENIDEVRAQKALKKAEQRLTNATSDSEQLKQQVALKKAINRIHVKRS